MGNSKHSTVSTSVSLPERNNFRQRQFSKRRKSDPNDYADVQLGRLRSVDFRLGKVFTNSGKNTRPDGLLLDRLWSPSITTFLFSRTCDRSHQGFGFSCDISFRKEDSFSEPRGLYVVRQMAKPKRRFKGLEDSPLDVFDIDPHFQRQVLGLVIKKMDTPNKSTAVLEGLTVFSIQGVLGHIMVKDDWTSNYELQNVDGELTLMAQRFNRISGGIEFQIYSGENITKTNKDKSLSSTPTPTTTCLATLVRLEENKFILKLYVPSTPVNKALMLSFTLLLIYLLSR